MKKKGPAALDVVLGGRTWPVEVERLSQTNWLVGIAGRRVSIDAEWTDADTLVMLVAGVVHTVRFQAAAEGALFVGLEGAAFEVVLPRRSDQGRTRQGRSGRRGPREGSSGLVKAPMPGRIVRLLAAVGDPVTAGQGLVVVEAMKMENELRAPKDGIVTEVHVQGGAAVEAGAVLVVVD